MNSLEQLRAALSAICADIAGSDKAGDVEATLDPAPRPEFGDYSTNAALPLAGRIGSAPREVAEDLSQRLKERLGNDVSRVEIAGPGFVNLFLSDRWYIGAVAEMLSEGEDYGSRSVERPERISVEFVSANPTGPLTAAGGRHAAYGDALARLLEACGHTVGREYYINDTGGQIDRLGQSISARATGGEMPEDGYQGEYVAELASAIPNAAELSESELAERGVALLLEKIKATLHDFRVDFDVWFSQRSLQDGERDLVDEVCKRLTELKHTYESEGALWLQTTDFGDDKDRVLRRSNGEYTYFASDIAYQVDKVQRGWERAIDVWGADHHGYVQRMRSAVEALELGDSALEMIIMQFVTVIERGERAAMSKRRGDFVTLDDLVRDIGVDATRFFLLQRSHDTTVDLDLDLAREQSNENPVYYVQYAHARIASMLRKLEGARVESARGDLSAEFELHPSERKLIRKLLAFPAEIEEAAIRRVPHRIAVYVLELAQDFTGFYHDCRVIGATPANVESFRIVLSLVTQHVIARALGLLGVSAPETM